MASKPNWRTCPKLRPVKEGMGIVSITIAFHSAYRQEADYKVFGDGQPYKIIFRYGADGPEGYNRTDPTFYGREIVAGIGILHRESGEMVKPEVLAAFQALWHQDGLRDPSPVTGWFNHDPASRIREKGYAFVVAVLFLWN